ncbi:MAG TPA: Calx-beta domain-containing protein, partial [Gaiellaceae bacterium]|nr:Calx-beta domain-containing protein [Gaiellaceae bacterium]
MSRRLTLVVVTAVFALAVTVASAAPPSGSRVSLSIADAAVVEGNAGTRALSFAVTASGSLKRSASVSYATVSGSAGAPGDYASASGSLTFDRRTKTRTLTVQVVGDTEDELDETFQVVLSNPVGATIADGVGIGTIADDDSPPVTGAKIAAAGDIACDPNSSFFNGGQGTGLNCRQLATSDLLVGAGYEAVLVLGDIQYEDGAYSKFLTSYDPSWGRVKAI